MNTPANSSPPARKKSKFVFTRQSRSKRVTDAPLSAHISSPIGTVTRRQLQAVGSDQFVRIANEQARYPIGPAWPVQMRADMVAAYLDYKDTRDLCKAVTSGAAPPPSSTRLIGKRTEVIWMKEMLDRFVAARAG